MNKDEFIINNFDEFKSEAIKVLERPTPKSQIKERDGGNGITLSYVDGAYVIRVLNKAFNYNWSWEIVDFRIVESQDKVVKKRYDYTKKRYVDLDEPIYEKQPPVAHVLGKLTVPGFGVKYGFGSKVIIGGASEQESIFKAAATDALKVAAKHFGIALDLYEDVPTMFDDDELPPRGKVNIDEMRNAQQDPEDVEEVVNSDIETLKELAAKLGVTSSDGLDPYVNDFSKGTIKTYAELPPSKLKLFLIYLATKVSELVGEWLGVVLKWIL